MSIDPPDSELLGILIELRKLPRETEWVEFKHNNAEPDEIGEYGSGSGSTRRTAPWSPRSSRMPSRPD
ncbi:MAG: hypothetical protein HY788_11845 [Deltaproteobacteria bacterium]|nr:hypothetical protein [Deltaproteobacteria bacterium]